MFQRTPAHFVSHLTTCSIVILLALTAQARADAETTEAIWQVEAGAPLPANIDVAYDGQSMEALPDAIAADPRKGPNRFSVESYLEPGTYTLALTYRNPEEHATSIHVEIDGRLQPRWDTYRFDPPGAERTYMYPFRVESAQKHRFTIGVSSMTVIYYKAFAPLEVTRLAVMRSDPVMPPASVRSRPYLDLWGWLAAVLYQRYDYASLEHMKQWTVDEPWKWGANFVQSYPYFFDNQWKASPGWGWDAIHAYADHCHKRGMLLDEHGGANPQRVDLNTTRILHWGRHDGNLLEKGWPFIADTWETEAIGYAQVKAGDESARTQAAIEWNHSLWTYNPGTPYNQCDQRPNTWQGGAGAWGCMDLYRGPNCIKTVMCANWNSMSYGAHPVIGYADMNPLRVFPGELGLNDGSRDLFIGYQADSRLFSFSPPGKTFGSMFGGGTTPDFILRQTDDMFRPRAMNPDQPHESAIWWLGETPPTLPTDLRDAVYAASMDPIRHAFTSRLSATAYNGTIHYRRLTNTLVHDEQSQGPWWPDANEAHPATTAFIQNNYFRMLRYANGDFGILQYDPQHLAHYDSNSLAVTMASTLPPESSTMETLAENVTTPIALECGDDFGAGMLEMTFGQVDTAEIVEVALDGVPQGWLTAAPETVARLPIDTGLSSWPKMTVTTRSGQAVGLKKICFDQQPYKASPSIVLDQTRPMTTTQPVEASTEDGQMLLPAQLATDAADCPASFKLTFDAPEGNYVLTVSAAGEGALRVYRDGYSAVRQLKDTVHEYKYGICGRFDIEATDVGRFSLPIDLHYTGEHTIELLAIKGRVSLQKLQISSTKVQHRWLERGGHRAVLEERIQGAGNKPDDVLLRRYTIDNDCPWLKVDIDFSRTSSQRHHVIATPHHDVMRSDGTTDGIIRLVDSSNRWPDLIVIVPDGKTLIKARWQKGSGITLQFADDAKQCTLYHVVPDVFTDAQLTALKAILTQPDPTIDMRKADKAVTVTNASDLPLVRTYLVTHPTEGPYFVCEDNWWHVRGAQPSRQEPGVDYLKIYSPANSEQRIQPYGFIDNVVRPGWGCQYLLALQNISSDAHAEAASCTVKVLSATAYIFAPRVEFKRSFDQVTLDGKPWPYHDGRFVFLPTARGTYDVAVVETGEQTPRLICSSGMLRNGHWDSSAKTLTLNIAMQPWTSSIPDGQYYYALIRHAGLAIDKIEGAELVDYANDADLSEALKAGMRANGFNIRFRPIDAGGKEIRIRFR